MELKKRKKIEKKQEPKNRIGRGKDLRGKGDTK